MSIYRNSPKRSRILLLAISTAMSGSALAASLSWDSSSVSPTHAVDGSGNWDTINTNTVWSNGIADTFWDNASTAVFGNANGAAGVVTIDDPSGSVTAAGLTFNPTGSGSYTIAALGSNTLNLSGSNPSINVGIGVSATISAPIAGGFASGTPGATSTTGIGLLLNGGGNLTLTSGSNTYSGSTTVSYNQVDRATPTHVTLANGASLGNTSGDVFVGFETSTSVPTTDSSSLAMGTSPTDIGTLTANNLYVNWNIGSQTISATTGGSLLINGNDTLNVNSIILDAGRATANTKGGFASLKLGAGATLTLNGAGGVGNSVNLLDIANYSYESGGGTGTGMAAIADFSLGTVNGTISTLNVATSKAGSGASAGFANGTCQFGNGSLSINTLNIARRGNSGQGAAGTFTLVSGATGNVTANAINFGNAGSTSGSTNGVLNINGGTLTLTGDITADTRVTGTATASAVINLAGGTLDMGGHNISLSNGSIPITLNATQGTLKNLNTINSTGGLTKSGAGTVVLLSTNAYTGPTVVTGGTLIANGANSMGTGGSLSVNSGTLDLAGFGQTVASLSGSGSVAVITSSVAGTATLNVNNGSGSYAGVIQDGGAGNVVALSVTGGSVTLNGTSTHTYSGNTTVSSGASLAIANINSTTNVTNNGSFAATGSVGAITVDGGGNLTPGPVVTSGTTGTLHGTSLTIGSGGGSLNFLANSLASFDQLLLSGGATLNAGLTLNVTLGTTVQSGTYTILSAPAGLTLNGNTVTPNVTVGGGGTTRISGNVSETATQIQLQVNGSPANLTWTGSADTTTWDIKNHQNWTSTSPSDPNRFYQQDNVTLDNSSSNLTINVTDPVQPGAVTFNNNASHNYVINGNGIGGNGNLTMNGAGSVTLNNVNTYAGATNVNAGNLIIGATGAIGGSTLTVASSASATVNAGGTISTSTINVSGALNDGGTVGGTTMILSSPANVVVNSGGTISTATVNVTGGSLTVQPGGALASSAISVSNGGSFTVQSSGALVVAPNLTANGAATFGSDQTINTLNGTDATSVVTQTGNLNVNAGGSYAGSIRNGDSAGNLNVNGGTLILTGSNSYTGTTNINSGAALQLDAGGNTASISPSSMINASGTFIYARTDSPSFPNLLSGGGAFRQVGGGTVTLIADNGGFSGGIQVYNGTVVQGSATALGSGGDLVLGTPGDSATTTPTGNLILSAAVPTTTIISISATNSSLTANPTPDLLTIPAGVTLTSNGAVTVGTNNGTVSTTLSATGGGALIVNGNITVGQTNDFATLDLSGLNSVTISNTTINVSNNAARQGTLTLANTTVAGAPPVNTVTTGTLNVSTPGSGNDISGVSIVNLGAGSNTIHASTINLGTVRGVGIMQFASGAPSSASIVITDQGGGGAANINIATETGNGTAGAGTSELLLAGHPANVQANNLVIATASSNQGATLVAGVVTFDTGTFTVNGQTTIGALTGGGVVTAGTTGNLTIGGSAPNNLATGFFSSGGITLGNFTNAVADVDTLAHVTSTLTINGGTANVNGSINNTSTHGNTISTVNLNAGTLNMNGNTIGGNGGVNSGNGPITVNFPAAGNTATLANLGGGGINGAGLAMNGAGTLQLAGAANYSGTTSVQSGQLVTLGDDARNAIFNNDGADITGGRLIFDYSTGTDPAVQVGTILSAGFAQTPIPFATGPLRTSSAPDSHKGLGWFDNIAAMQLTVRYTWFGDANLDGKVNALDFNAVATNFGISNGTQIWSHGDFNYDGTVNTSDFTAVAMNFNQSLPTPAPALGSLVPEPGVIPVCTLLAAFISRRRKKE